VREQRRLAAIVSADVAGYSRLMGRDESGTLAALKALRREMVDPRIATHGGRIVKTTGDGLLLEFPSVVDAVRCVVEVQTEMAQKIADVPDDRRIAFRIGLHVGDIIIDGDDIFDGVNIAARLQEIATAGGVCVSSRVHDDVRDRLETVFEDGGAQTLKNITRPVHVWRWMPGSSSARATNAPSPADVPLALPDKPSIAVLPFQNMSGDPEQEYFADGVVEDIITALSRFKSLFVIARNSSFTYKGKAVDIKQVERELGVRYVLEGSVRKAGNRVRITGQLIDAESGAHLWADRFDGELADIFDLQDQVTGRVVAAVAPRVEQAEIDRAGHHPARNLDAYDCYLRGLARANEYTNKGLEEALQLARRAYELDPDFSSAYGLAAYCYGASQVQGLIEDQAKAEAEVQKLAARISLIGRDDAYALSAAAFATIRVCRDHATSAALADQALAVNPNLPAALSFRAEINLHNGDHAASIEEATRAIRLSPRDPMIFVAELLIAFAHMFEGRYGEAIEWATRSLSRSPNNAAGLRVAACAYALSGRTQEAAKAAAQLCELVPSLRVGEARKRSLYRRPQDSERLYEGLRLAGVPE
jgi:TolB-like protein/class 3 adenylate cyclase/tetratricopeptide (TPR) repeat protein